jgi:hypothetical protein
VPTDDGGRFAHERLLFYNGTGVRGKTPLLVPTPPDYAQRLV